MPEALIKERAESGMTIKEWCHKHGAMNPNITTGQGRSVQMQQAPYSQECLLWNFLLSAVLPRLQRQTV